MTDVKYNDPTPNNFPDDYDPDQVDSRIKLRSYSIKHKKYGKYTREALYQGLEIGGAIAQEAKSTADAAKTQSQNINDRFNDQISGSTNDNEVIDFRHSDMLSKSFTTAKSRGDFWDSSLLDYAVDVKWFGAVGDGTTDDTNAFKDAIDYIGTQWSSNSRKADTLVIPSGKYVISDTITIPPYICLKPTGIVHLLSKISTDDIPLIWINWTGSDPTELLDSSSAIWGNQEWQRTLIDDSQGVLNLVGDSKQGTGLEIGYHSTSDSKYNTWDNFARSVFKKVNITKFSVGIMINCANTFILNFENCHIENCHTNVRFGNLNRSDFSAGNSGENIAFNNSIIANGNIGFDMQYGGFDVNLFGCALDFNTTLFKGGEYANSSLKIFGGNAEGNTKVYDGAAALNHQTYQTDLNIIGTNILIHKYAEDSPLFSGPLALRLDNPYLIVDGTDASENLGNGQLLNKLIDSNVTLSISRNLMASRRGIPAYISERENELDYGTSLANISYQASNSNTSTLATGSEDADFQALSSTAGSIKYTRPSDGSDTIGWDTISFSQKINLIHRNQFYVSTLAKISTSSVPTYRYVMSFYDSSDNLLTSSNLPVSVSTTDLNRIGTFSSKVESVPVNASYAKLTVGIGGIAEGESVEVGYVRVVTAE